MDSIQQVSKTSIILTNTETWDDWFGNIRRIALSADIWNLINPDTDEAVLIRPEFPSYGQVKPTATTFAELNASEREEWQRINRQYTEQNDEFKQKRKALNGLVGRIQDTIDRRGISYIAQCDTPYQMIRKLKSRYCATEETREVELAAKFRRHLYSIPKSGNIEEWLTELERIYTQCEGRGLIASKSSVIIKEFLDNISSIDQAFADQWDSVISRGELKNLEFQGIIQHFRNWRIQRAQRNIQGRSKAAFSATFQDKTTEESASKESESKGRKPCLCGEEHLWKTCLYLIPSLRSKNWKPDSTIKAKVDEQLKKPKLKKIVAKINKKVTDQEQPLQSATDDSEKSTEAVFTSHETQYSLYNSFILDSGATTHICNNRQRFEDDFEEASDMIIAGDGQVQVKGYGTVRIQVTRPSGKVTIKLGQVAFIPQFQTNTVSLRRLLTKGINWNPQKGILIFEEKLWCQVPQIHNQFLIDYQPIDSQSAFPADSRKPRPPLRGTIEQWHYRMGHLYEEAVKHLPKTVNGVTLGQSKPLGICETCRISQAPQQISRRTPEKPTIPFQEVHFDLIQVEKGFNNDNWVLHFLEKSCDFHFVYTLQHKSDITTAIQDFTALVENQFGCKIQVFFTDGERSLGKVFEQWAASKGITIKTSAPYTQAQNGSAERSGGVIINRARALKLHSNLPSNLWPELARTAAHLLNRSPVRHLGWKTSYEALRTALMQKNSENSENTIKVPDLSYLRVIGCKAYVRIPNIPRLKKMDPRAFIGYLIGYESTNSFRIWVPQRRKVIITRDVIFDEDSKYNPEEKQQVLAPEIIEIIENPLLGQEIKSTTQVEIPFLHQEVEIPKESNPSGLLTPSTDASNRFITLEVDSGQLTEEETPSRNNLQIQNMPGIAPRDINSSINESNIIPGSRLRTNRQETYFANLEQPQEMNGFHAAFAVGSAYRPESNPIPKVMEHQLPAPPKNWKEMLRHTHSQGFRAAAEKEFRTLEQLGTFKPVNRPEINSGKQLLPLMWVFTYKFNQDGYLVKYKARLCIRGDLQKANSKDTYAATLAVQVFRALMAIAAAYNLEAKQLDAINAFVNSRLDEEVYCKCPPGFEYLGPCLQVLRALYGLRRSPKLWYNEFTQTLKELGMHQVIGQLCLFTNGSVILFFYVDDIVLIGRNLEEIEDFKKALISRYEMRDLGNLQWFLGIRIIRDRPNRRILLSQDAYIEKLISKFKLESHRPTYTPLPANKLIPNEGQATLQEIYAFQQRIGSIMYAAVVTRADTAYAVNLLSRFLLNPSQKHLEAADHCIAYLNTYRTLAIQYSDLNLSNQDTNATGPRVFYCSSDAAFADNPDRKSSYGYLFKLYGGPIAWKATKQQTITTSSTEAELLAISTTAKEAIWWQRLFKSLDFDTKELLQIDCDNRQTIRLLVENSPILPTKLRHVDIHQHWLRQEVQAKRVAIQWVSTNDMPADGLTKPLTRQKHERFVRLLGLVDIKNELPK
jgi:hypothetical protein